MKMESVIYCFDGEKSGPQFNGAAAYLDAQGVTWSEIRVQITPSVFGMRPDGMPLLLAPAAYHPGRWLIATVDADAPDPLPGAVRPDGVPGRVIGGMAGVPLRS